MTWNSCKFCFITMRVFFNQRNLVEISIRLHAARQQEHNQEPVHECQQSSGAANAKAWSMRSYWWSLRWWEVEKWELSETVKFDILRVLLDMCCLKLCCVLNVLVSESRVWTPQMAFLTEILIVYRTTMDRSAYDVTPVLRMREAPQQVELVPQN